MTSFEQQVRERAYFIWDNEGRADGGADGDWLRAEAELKAPVIVEAVAASRAPAPAKALAKTLKAKAAPARAAAVKAVSEAAPKSTASKGKAETKARRVGVEAGAAIH